MKFLLENDFMKYKDANSAFNKFLSYLEENKSKDHKGEDYHFELTKMRLKPEDFDPLIGGKFEISEIIDNLKQNKIVVIDLSEANNESLKLSLFLSVAEELKEE